MGFKTIFCVVDNSFLSNEKLEKPQPLCSFMSVVFPRVLVVWTRGDFSFPAGQICTWISTTADLGMRTVWTAGKAARPARARDRGEERKRGEVVDRWFPPQ